MIIILFLYSFGLYASDSRTICINAVSNTPPKMYLTQSNSKKLDAYSELKMSRKNNKILLKYTIVSTSSRIQKNKQVKIKVLKAPPNEWLKKVASTPTIRKLSLNGRHQKINNDATQIYKSLGKIGIKVDAIVKVEKIPILTKDKWNDISKKFAKAGMSGLVNSNHLTKISDFTFLINKSSILQKVPNGNNYYSFLQNKKGQYIKRKCCLRKNIINLYNKNIKKTVSIVSNTKGRNKLIRNKISKKIEEPLTIELQNLLLASLDYKINKKDLACGPLDYVLSNKSKNKIILNDMINCMPDSKISPIANNQLEITKSINKILKKGSLNATPIILNGVSNMLPLPIKVDTSTEITTFVGPFNSIRYDQIDTAKMSHYLKLPSQCTFLKVLKEWNQLCANNPNLISSNVDKTDGCSVQIGDGFHPKKWGYHASHGDGNCVDVRPFRKYGSKLAELDRSTKVGDKKRHYSQAKTWAFIRLLKYAGASPIFFNDKMIIKNEKEKGYKISTMKHHSNHIHFCFNKKKTLPQINKKAKDFCLSNVSLTPLERSTITKIIQKDKKYNYR